MSPCKVCGAPRSAYILNNKTVCLRCDELLFDLEIECEEEIPTMEERSPAKPEAGKILNPAIKK
jgi:hypothetical protein